MKKSVLSVLLAAALLLSLVPAALAESPETYTDALVDYLKVSEGFVERPYSDGTSWYIGYGCCIDPADYPDGITEEAAEALLREYLDRCCAAVLRYFTRHGVSVTQGQLDAMCCMTYALGTVWLDDANRLPRYLIAGLENYTDQQIASAMAAWCHVGGLPNLVALRRRIIEAKMFLDDDYSFTDEGWCWLILDANGGENAVSGVAVYRTGEPYGVLPEAVGGAGWTFEGWETPDGALLRETDIVAENLRLTARWTVPPADETPGEEPPEEVPAFPDVPEGAWYEESVRALVGAGVVCGYEDGSFRPNGSVTWGEALKLVLLSAGYPAQDPAEPEEGAPKPHWASGYLAFAEEKGFVAEGRVTDLNAPLDRDAVADLCAAALELGVPAGMEDPFADTSRASVLALYAADILLGSFDEAGRRVYKGADLLRRCEICAVMVRVQDWVRENLILYLSYRIPLDKTLRSNPYDPEKFTTDARGRVRYDDETLSVRYGIDVSSYQGEIDWAAVAADGVEFAIIRCGYRGYAKGTLAEDVFFRRNVSEALRCGLDVGVYFFSQALSEDEAREEAQYVLSLIEGYSLRYPVVFDWEPIARASSRTLVYDGKTVCRCAEAFNAAVAAAGYTPMCYFNPSIAYLKYDMQVIQRYNNWLAHYVPVSSYPYDFQLWQYGSSGSVNGIEGSVDMDIDFGRRI